MSEATDQIVQTAHERVTTLKAEVADLQEQIAPRAEEIKKHEAVIAIYDDSKKKSNRGRPKRDKTDEVKNVLKSHGPMHLDELAALLGMRPSALSVSIQKIGGLDYSEDHGWALANA